MDLLRSEIINITKTRPEIGLKYYADLLDIIDSHHDKKPDTSIETCKAIIEGISKLIIHKIQQEPLAKLDKSKDFKELTKRALNVLNDKNDFFEIEFVRGITNIANKIGTSRNDHSDIGHGRASIKEQVSCSDFSQMIAGFTESISVYLLKKLDEVIITENHFDSEQMEMFNDWLDNENPDFPIQTERYSKILFEYDRDLYYLKFSEEFIELQEEQEEKEEKAKEKEKKEASVIEFESDFFNSIEDKSLITEFSNQNNLDARKLSEVLDTYFFTNEYPSKGRLSDLFIDEGIEHLKPEIIKVKINKLVDQLTKTK